MAYGYYPNNQYYMQDLQNMRDRIENQIRNIQQQNQMQQPTNLTQNFQIAPNVNNNEIESKYVNSIDEVKNTFVMKMGVFVNKDFSTLWVKEVNGNIRTFKTEEIIELDEKDREILDLQRQVNELKGMINNNANEYDNTNIIEPIESKKPQRVSNNKRSNAK